MKPKLFRKVLKNGMTVIHEKRDSSVVSVAYAVRYGGINEQIPEKGIAHFIEHMLYKGNKKMGTKEISEAFERRGGIMNGFTDEQMTAFWVKAPMKHFLEIFKVLTEMVKNPDFDEKEMGKERKVIFEEIKMRNDNPRLFAMEKIKTQLYDGHFAFDVIGTFESLSSVDRKKIVEKFKRIYQPQNMICGIVGNVNIEEVCNFLEKNFKKGEGKVEEIPVKTKNGSKIANRKGIDQANFVLAFHTPKANEKESHAAEILACLMGGGLSSRLFQEIREKRNLAYSVSSDCVAEKDFGYTFVYAGTTKEKMEDAKKLILEEFDKVAKDLDKKEFESVKEQVIGNFQVSQEDSQDALNTLLYEEIAGNAENILKFEENIRKVKLEDVKKLAGKVKDNYSFFALVPE